MVQVVKLLQWKGLQGNCLDLGTRLHRAVRQQVVVSNLLVKSQVSQTYLEEKTTKNSEIITQTLLSTSITIYRPTSCFNFDLLYLSRLCADFCNEVLLATFQIRSFLWINWLFVSNLSDRLTALVV